VGDPVDDVDLPIEFLHGSEAAGIRDPGGGRTRDIELLPELHVAGAAAAAARESSLYRREAEAVEDGSGYSL
jgi:hypothetical protein